MDNEIKKCKYCGSDKMVIGYQQGFATIFSDSTSLNGCRVIHKICIECGSILYSRVEDPKKLKNKFSTYNLALESPHD